MNDERTNGKRKKGGRNQEGGARWACRLPSVRLCPLDFRSLRPSGRLFASGQELEASQPSNCLGALTLSCFFFLVLCWMRLRSIYFSVASLFELLAIVVVLLCRLAKNGAFCHLPCLHLVSRAFCLHGSLSRKLVECCVISCKVQRKNLPSSVKFRNSMQIEGHWSIID